jgi:cobalt/nickel transport system permease protein
MNLSGVSSAVETLPQADDVGSLVRQDPVARMLILCTFAFTVVLLQQLPTLVMALLMAVATLLAGCNQRVALLRRLLAVNGFVLMMLVVLPFSVSGTPAFSWLGFVGTHEGLHQGSQIALRANTVVLLTLVLLGGLEPAQFAQALKRLRIPAALVTLLLFTVRYVYILREEYMRMHRAMRTRGFVLRNSRHTYVTLGFATGMLLVRALDRSERMLGAMKCRGFKGQMPELHIRRLQSVDLAYVFLAVALCAALLTLDQ